MVDRITQEKLELETQAAEQAETCRQLTDANNSLSARVLKLAEENNSASSSDVTRKKLESELAECKTALEKAQEEIDAVVGTSRLPTFSDRPNLPYVEAVVNETMRIATPVPLGECFLPASCSASQRAWRLLASLLVYCVVSLGER